MLGPEKFYARAVSYTQAAKAETATILAALLIPWVILLKNDITIVVPIGFCLAIFICHFIDKYVMRIVYRKDGSWTMCADLRIGTTSFWREPIILDGNGQFVYKKVQYKL